MYNKNKKKKMLNLKACFSHVHSKIELTKAIGYTPLKVSPKNYLEKDATKKSDFSIFLTAN